jgi:hypothetical protein
MALMSREHDGESLPITGPEALDFASVTAKSGAAIGRRLVFQPISDEEARQRYAASGASPEDVAAHVSLWRAIREGRLAKVTDNVERILGRKPINLDRWVSEKRQVHVAGLLFASLALTHLQPLPFAAPMIPGVWSATLT